MKAAYLKGIHKTNINLFNIFFIDNNSELKIRLNVNRL